MRYFSLFIFIASAAAGATTPGPVRCTSFTKNLHLPNTTITGITYMLANTTFISDIGHPTCVQNASIPVDLCRLEMTTYTSPGNNSRVKTELWLPDFDGTNRPTRIGATGNGGFNGCVDMTMMYYMSSLGFATIGSDNGHAGQTGEPFLDKPEVINDFAERAIHIESVLAKTVFSAYYGEKNRKSYFVACSTGGRQAFKSIEKHPGDFDGVLAGAPAVDWNKLVSWSGQHATASVAGTDGEITAEILASVTKDALEQCDAVDGVVEEPDSCQYTPSETLLSSLTAAQRKTLATMLSPLRVDGKEVYPALDPGTGYEPVAYFSADYFRYMVYNNSNLDVGALLRENMGAAVKKAEEVNPGNIRTWSPETVVKYGRAGGKVLTYHGRADPIIPGANSVRLYNAVSSAAGGKGIEDWYRLFSVPGMAHCYGPSWFGQMSESVQAGEQTVENNAVLALVEWVEKGTAPAEFEVRSDPTVGESVRRICSWPKRGVVKEGGDRGKVEDWECVSP